MQTQTKSKDNKEIIKELKELNIWDDYIKGFNVVDLSSKWNIRVNEAIDIVKRFKEKQQKAVNGN